MRNAITTARLAVVLLDAQYTAEEGLRSEMRVWKNEFGFGSNLLARNETVRAWHIEVNGRSLTDLIGGPINTMVMTCARDPKKPDESLLGYLEYGAEPKADGTLSAYDTFIFKERGGAATMPYVFIEGELYVGVVEQRRNPEVDPEYNPTGKVWNVPRGFNNFKGLMADTAARECRGEVGVFEGEIFRLPGENVNANNAWFAYYPEQGLNGESVLVPVRQGGVAMFAVEVRPNHLVKSADGDWYAFSPEALGPRPKGSPYEVIGSCRFIRVYDAVDLRDALTLCAVARLLIFLADQV